MPQNISLRRNTVYLLLSNLGSAALAFLLSVLIGRELGAAGLGIYATVMAWIFPLSLVAEFGLGTLMTRDVAQDPSVSGRYIRLAVNARLWIGGGLTLLMMIGAPLVSHNPDVARGLQLSAPLILIFPLFGTYTAILRARQIMWPIPWLNIGMLVIQVLITAIILQLGGQVLSTFVINTLTSFGQLLALWWIWQRWFDPTAAAWFSRMGRLLQSDHEFRIWWRAIRGWWIQEWIIFKSSAIPLLRLAWPFALAGLLAAVQVRIGIVLLERLAAPEEAGAYAAASRFSEAARVIPNALFGAVFPMLATVAQERHQLQRLFSRLFVGLTGYALLIGLIFQFGASLILQWTYGAAFEGSAVLLQLIMWILLPGLLRNGATLYWYAVGRERFINTITVLMLGIQMVISFTIIPTTGAIGAVIALAIVEVLGLAIILTPILRRWFSR
jgi:O-antigen/teichoic acid export membrane protein